MPASIKFIINFEEPCVHVKIICYKLGQLKKELLLVVDIYCGYGSGHVCETKNFLTT